MQIARDEISLTMSHDDLRRLATAVDAAVDYWERTKPARDIEDGADAQAMDAFSELEHLKSVIVTKGLTR